MTLIEDTIAIIRDVDERARAQAEAYQLQLTKPAGALGALEALGNQLCAISGQCPPPLPQPAMVQVFAADHGVHAQGVSPWPQEVTVQMARNIVAGGAGVNAIARTAGAHVVLVDMGMAAPIDGGFDCRIAAGTADFTTGPAMSRGQARAGIETGIQAARRAGAEGFRALVPGEVGIANTTSAAALIAALTGARPDEVTGRGAGADDAMLAHKVSIVARALELHRDELADPLGALAAVGGFEQAGMVGMMLGAAAQRIPVVLDGAIACSAALVAVRMCPAVRGYLIAGHDGQEPGIARALDALGLAPVLRMGLRLGEGSGGALALPVVVAAAQVLREMATFDGAGVTQEHS